MSRTVRIKGPSRIVGELKMPGDKSISHRVAMLASIAKGRSTITGFASSADCHSTLNCVESLGVPVVREPDRLTIHGRGLWGWRPRKMPVTLDAGNSGSTIRMLTGLLAGQEFGSFVDGDGSLKRRPMNRIIEPLRSMGAEIKAAGENYPPLRIRGSALRGIDYQSPVA
ncbi:MAG TPA: 3-phosphoshikimate 1-carboxyvinyltransferase, partial [Blastocatellia bacterium]|nr:3-phosphoshikimate 1-carboxyvinyltransferase [Blastocatellia bacterium]